MTDHGRLHADDIAVDTDLARTLIADQFPAWANLPIRRIPSAGTVNAIFRLGDDLVLRIPRAESYVWYLELLGANHQWLQWAAPQVPLAIPEPIAIGEATDAYPWPWPIHRWIEGTTLDAIDLKNSVDLAERLATFVRALHSLPPAEGPRSAKAISRAAWDPMFRRLVPDLEGIIDTRRAIEAWDLTMDAASWSGPFPWTHADLLPGNLVVRNGRLSAVLDFECLGTGDPALDLCTAWSLFDRPTREVFRDAVGVDDQTWLRAANLALRGVMGIRYYATTNPRFAELARSWVTEAIDELVPINRRRH